ncbi:MAG: hypothetical protein K8T20_03480 [Planctomycetes bacterium]|nr:hypothetical protein [Planctomycetota bacterium]
MVTVVPGADAPPGAAAVVSPAAEVAPPRAVEQLSQERFVAAKEDGRRVRTHLPLCSLSGLGLLVAFFCLPWLRVSCAVMVTAEPTGYDLATNSLDPNAKELQAKANSTKDAVKKVSGTSMDSFMNLATPEPVKDPPWGGKTRELWIFPAFGALLFGWSVFRMAVPSWKVGRETAVLVFLVLGCGGLLAYERVTWYRKKPLQNMRADAEKALDDLGNKGYRPATAEVASLQRDVLEYLVIKDQPGVWLSVISLAFAAIVMAAWLVASASKAG